jgi:CheY-like chemotaxis protein
MKVNTILLVDDDNVTNFINERLINKLNIAQNVKVTSNGEEGITFIKEYCQTGNLCPEIIFLDINMPVMDGFEFIRAFEELKEVITNKTKIVILTTSTNANDIEKLKYLGNFDFINKPLTEEKLFNCLTKVLS